jgi:hypothetical protein
VPSLEGLAAHELLDGLERYAGRCEAATECVPQAMPPEIPDPGRDDGLLKPGVLGKLGCWGGNQRRMGFADKGLSVFCYKFVQRFRKSRSAAPREETTKFLCLVYEGARDLNTLSKEKQNE